MHSPEHDPQTQRLFFALWPDDALRQQLQRNCKSLLCHPGGRPVPMENYHLTLAFLGRVEAGQRACVEAMAGTIQNPRFTLQLTQAGHWLKPRVLWIAPAQIPEALTTLAAALHDGAQECGLQLDAHPYHAHLTLKRKLTRPPRKMDFQPVQWKADRFVLVNSIIHPQGVQYEMIREWGLAN